MILHTGMYIGQPCTHYIVSHITALKATHTAYTHSRHVMKREKPAWTGAHFSQGHSHLTWRYGWCSTHTASIFNRASHLQLHECEHVQSVCHLFTLPFIVCHTKRQENEVFMRENSAFIASLITRRILESSIWIISTRKQKQGEGSPRTHTTSLHYMTWNTHTHAWECLE